MLARFRGHLRSNVVGYVALFFALGGVAVAAPAFIKIGAPAGGDLTGAYPNPLIAPNAVGSAEVINDSLTDADIAASAQFNGAAAGGDLTGSFPNPLIGSNAVGSAEVANDTLTGDDIDESTLGGIGPGDAYADGPNSATLDLDGAVVASLSLPAGDYVVNASLRVQNDTSDATLVDCLPQLSGENVGVTYVDQLDSWTTLSFTEAISVSPASTLDLFCRNFDAVGTVSADQIRLVATRVGTLHQQ